MSTIKHEPDCVGDNCGERPCRNVCTLSECPRCNGTGAQGVDASDGITEYRCVVCNGAGVLNNKPTPPAPCHLCNGTMVVPAHNGSGGLQRCVCINGEEPRIDGEKGSTPPAPTDAEVREARDFLRNWINGNWGGSLTARHVDTLLTALDKAQGEVERMKSERFCDNKEELDNCLRGDKKRKLLALGFPNLVATAMMDLTFSTNWCKWHMGQIIIDTAVALRAELSKAQGEVTETRAVLKRIMDASRDKCWTCAYEGNLRGLTKRCLGCDAETACKWRPFWLGI